MPSSPTVPGKFRKAEQHGWGEFEYDDRLHFFGGLVIHGLGTKSNVRRVSREKSACCSIARKSPGPARCKAAPLLVRGPRSPTAEPHRVRVAPGGPVAREPFRPPGRRWRSAVVSGRAVRQAACGVPGPRAAPLRGRVWVRAPTSPSPSSKQQRPRLLRPPRGTRAGEGGGERRASAGSPGGGGQGRRPRPWRSLTRPAPVGSPGLTQKHLLGALVRGSLGGDEPLARGSEGSGRVPRCFNRRAVLESALNCADQVGTGFPTIPNQKCRRQRQPRRQGSALGRGPRGHGTRSAWRGRSRPCGWRPGPASPTSSTWSPNFCFSFVQFGCTKLLPLGGHPEAFGICNSSQNSRIEDYHESRHRV